MLILVVGTMVSSCLMCMHLDIKERQYGIPVQYSFLDRPDLLQTLKMPANHDNTITINMILVHSAGMLIFVSGDMI